VLNLKRSATLQAALRFVTTSSIPGEHKATLIEVLTQAMRDDDAAQVQREAVAQSEGEWQEHEIMQMKAFLLGRTATSWQHADECVMQLVAQLHRSRDSVRVKAKELGFGAAVDFAVARQLKLSRDE
jgi:hypothetical protein